MTLVTTIDDDLEGPVLRITISRPGNAPEIRELDLQEVAIGGRNTPERSNDLLLPHVHVSSAHARLNVTQDGLVLTDLQSRNGTFVDGTQITNSCLLEPGQIVTIGPYKVAFESVGGLGQGPPIVDVPSVGPPILDGPPPLDLPIPPPVNVAKEQVDTRVAHVVQATSESARGTLLEQVFHAIKGEFASDISGAARDLQSAAQARAEELLGQSSEIDAKLRRRWAIWITREIYALGPLTDLLGDSSVSEILVHGPSAIEALRHGLREDVPVRFSCTDAIRWVVERLTNARLSAARPVIDATTPDGISVHAVDRPLAVDGPLVLLTRPAEYADMLTDLVRRGALSEDAQRYLQKCIQDGLNLLLCSAGAASTLPLVAALTAELPPPQRLVVVHRGEVWRCDRAIVLNGFEDMARSMRVAQRLRPDWLVVLELVGVEAAELCAAARRTHGGTLCTMRATSAASALDRLQAMVAACGGHPDPQTCRGYVAGCFDVIVCMRRAADNLEVVASISETRLTRGVELIEVFGRDHGADALLTQRARSAHE